MFESLNFPEILILVLIGLLFFKENMLAWLGKKMGFTSSSEIPHWAHELLDEQATLKQYFNHDTTAQHDKTHEILTSIDKKLDEHNKVEQANSGKLDEIIKYGVKCNTR